MKYTLYLLACLFFSNLFANDKTKLEEAEIKEAEKIEFQNKSRKKAASETKHLHESIGRKLAGLISNKPDEAHSIDGVKAIRVGSNEKNKFGADIIYLDASTSFGHINSIHRVLSGYIQAAFDYNSAKADILAIYVLYYNGMHRGNISFFESKYSKALLKKLSSSNVGIAIKYKDWPGKTEIIIPIEKNILKEFQKDVTLNELENEVNKIINDKKNGEEDRKKFAELMKEKGARELMEINQKVEELERLEKEIEAKQKSIQERLTELKKDPEKNKDEIAKLEKEYEALEKQKKDIKKQKEDLIQREEQLTGVASPKRTPKVIPLPQEEKKVEVKLDPRLLEPEYSSHIVDGKLVFIKPFSDIDSHCVNGIHLLDPAKEDFIYTSEYNKICGKTFKVMGDNILVIGFLEKKEQIKLVLLKKNDLKVVGNSEVNVYHKTPIEIRGDFLYAIENLDGKFYLTRFDGNLKSLTRSKEEVNPDSIITFYDNKIYVSTKKENGQVEFKVFKKEDLSFIKKTQA
jgi:hypothetical protein